VPEYALPTVPTGREEVLIPKTVILRLAVAVSELLSVTFTVKPDAPAALGVPLIVPPLDSESPAGGVPFVILHT
jgi:hypothetical protein